MKFIEAGKPALILAPMEGVTDAPMREFLCGRGGFDFCVTEFLRISQDVASLSRVRTHVAEVKTGSMTADGTPVQVQLLGGSPEKLAQSALVAIAAGAKGIDLNFGCPAPTVNRHDGGATILKDPIRLRSIVETVRKAVPSEYPVSAKLRLGFFSNDEIDETSAMAAEGGASWITIHARTKVQGYAPPAYWGHIRRVRERLNVPVVANGEIWSLEDYRRCRDETGCEHFMIGRGVFANPNLPLQIAAESRHGDLADFDSPEQWVPLFRAFAETCLRHGRPANYALRRLKQWMSFVRMRRPVAWFEPLKRLDTLEELFKSCADIVGSNHDQPLVVASHHPSYTVSSHSSS